MCDRDRSILIWLHTKTSDGSFIHLQELERLVNSFKKISKIAVYGID